MKIAVRLVGLSLLVAVGACGTDANGDSSSGDSHPQSESVDAAGSIEGRWILESWEEGGVSVIAEVGVNTVGEAWIEFTQDFKGARDSFVSADGLGTAGTFIGSTGCNGIRETGYEFSAGFLVLDEAVVQAVGCEPNGAEQALLAMLWNTSDGIEVVMDGDRMEWFGSNLEGIVKPLVFRRDGSQPFDPGSDSSTITAPSEGAPAVRVYEVAGVEVVTVTRLDELPERAVQVEFLTTVIDSGDGPELCIAFVLTSLPPQCSGPIAASLDMGGWSQELNGVRWGDRAMVVTWPPIDGVVTVVADSAFVPWDVEFPPDQLPAECRDVETRAGAGAINDYAGSLGASNGGLYVANDGTLVLQVVGDPTPHRAALAEFGGACVVEVSHSEAEQRSIQDALTPLLADLPELAGNYIISTGAGGRVVVQVPVADRATALVIASLVDDPTAIRVVGIGILDR
ncbi:MAG TPA: hypothetical protein VFY15_00780 [Acidimicrobiia bacterium]|nr:hypothetical protein [Acidimicrobiia bacterium]